MEVDTELALLALRGIGLAATFMSFDEKDSEGAGGDEEAGVDIVLDGEEDVLTGDGPDTISGATGGNVSTTGGDDVISLGIGYNLVDGGDGNDDIYIEYGYSATVEGGAGDDTISAAGLLRGEIRGGEGDDRLVMDDDYTYDEDSRGHGGAGDDVLEVGVMLTGEAAEYEQYNAAPWISGDAGADVFEVTLNPVGAGYLDEPSVSETLVTVGDFNQAEDSLVVDLSDVGTDSTFLGAEMVADDVGTGSILVLRFDSNEAGDFQVGQIFLPNAPGPTMDDVTLILPAAA